MPEMQWEIDQRTIRDCPGGRTELEWRHAVSALADELAAKHESVPCPTCGQSIHVTAKFRVTETEHWLPSGPNDLPRGRWARDARAHTLEDARVLQKFMGPRATIWRKTKQEQNSTTYEELENDKHPGRR